MASNVITTTLVAPTDPALPPPPNVVPDWQDPYTLRPYHNVIVSLSLFFSGIFVLLRLYTKTRLFKKLIWEDYTCILGFLGFVGYAITGTLQVDARGGTHQWNISTTELERQHWLVNIGDMVYSLGVLFIKFSLLLFMLRLFCPERRDPLYWILQSLNVCNTIFYAIYFIIPIVACTPRTKIWKPETQGKCLNVYALYMSSAAFNVLSDLAMFFVPLWRIWHLNISRARRIGVSAIFFVGGLAIIASILRLIFVSFLLSHADYSYVKIQSTLATYAELGFGIIASCLFVLPRLYRHLAAVPPYDSEATTCRRCKNSIGSGENTHGRARDNSRMDGYSRGNSIPFGQRNDFLYGQASHRYRTDAYARGKSIPIEESDDIVEDSCHKEVQAPTAAASRLFQGEKQGNGKRSWLSLEEMPGYRDSPSWYHKAE